MYEDDINLRYYIGLLLKNWKWLVLGGLITAFTAFAISRLQPTNYEATAAVAVVRSRTDARFDDRIETLDDYELGGGRLAGDRLTALVSLADGNEIVEHILDDTGDEVSSAQSVDDLRRMLSAETTGDLIAFSVRSEDPELAARVANSWAQSYVTYINQLYGGSGDNSEVIASQVASARGTYETAQQELQDFLADEEVLELTRQLESELAIKTELLNGYQQSLVAMETNEANKLAQIETWLADAHTLREQVSASPGSVASSVGDMLSLIMLRSRVYGVESEGGGPVALQLDLTSAQGQGISAADVDNLIDVLERRREATQERIAALPTGADTGEANTTTFPARSLTERINTLRAETIELETQLENEMAIREAQRIELEAARDRAWDAYQALTTLQVETEIQASSSSTEVRLADRALTPQAPVGSGVLINTLLGSIVGVVAAIGIVLLVDWWLAGERVIRQNAEIRRHGDYAMHRRDDNDDGIPDRQQGVSETAT